jgi:hypothetical protein
MKKVRKFSLVYKADPLIALLPLWLSSAIIATGEDETQWINYVSEQC